MSGPDIAGWLTLSEAAGLVGLSRRTLRRAVDAGELSATLRPWGKRERWEVQGAELARWAEAHGHDLAMTRPENLEETPASEGESGGHGRAPAGTVSMTRPQMPAESEGKLRALAAEAAELRAQVRALEAKLAAEGELLGEVRADRDHWREAHQITLRMLPAAREVRVPWWRRVFGGRRGGHEEGGPGA